MALHRDWWAFTATYATIALLLALWTCAAGCGAPRGRATLTNQSTTTTYMRPGGAVDRVERVRDVRATTVQPGGAIEAATISDSDGVGIGTGAGQEIDHQGLQSGAIMTWVGVGLLVAGVLSLVAKLGGFAVPILAIIPTGASVGLCVAGGLLLFLPYVFGQYTWLLLMLALGAGLLWAYGNGMLSNFNQRRQLVKAQNGGEA